MCAGGGGTLSGNLVLCLMDLHLHEQMSDATQDQLLNMWQVIYILETILKTGLWQIISQGRGCCVSLVTFIALVSMWHFIFSYAHQEFSVLQSVKLDAKIQMVASTLGQENAAEKIKSNITGKISVLKFSYALLAEVLRLHKTCPKYFPPNIFERWFIVSISPGNFLFIVSS